MKSHVTKDYRGGPGFGRCMCLSLDLSESPNKLSNYVLLVMVSYKMTINSENKMFET